jgi:hypothetical protein
MATWQSYPQENICAYYRFQRKLLKDIKGQFILSLEKFSNEQIATAREISPNYNI